MLRVFLKIVKFKLKAWVEYRGAFFAGITAQWFGYGLDICVIYLIVWQFGTIAGWLPEEVVFLYAVWLLTYAIGAAFTFNVAQQFQYMAINGAVDEALTRPMPSLAFLIATGFNIGYISHVTITIAALVFSMTRLVISWTALQWIWFVVVIISGAIIQGCMMLICDMPSLRTRSRSFTGMFFWDMRMFLQYPLNIYPKSLQLILTTILPFGFINFYPLQALLGKSEGAFTGGVQWLSPLVAVILLCITAMCWRLVMRRYESAGT